MATRILVIEDDPATLSLYQDLLDLEGYTCVAYTTPFITIDEVAKIAPRLIILDWHFGGIEGTSLPSIEFVMGLRQSPTTAHLPILVCSALGAELDSMEGWFAAQNVGLLEKPFQVDALLARIAALVDGASA